MNYCAVLASGKGMRMKSSGIPKQFIEIEGKPLIYYTLRTIMDCKIFDKIYIGLSKQYLDFGTKILERYFVIGKRLEIVLGGEQRIETFFNILDRLTEDNIISDYDYMCLTDANRPLTSKKIYLECMRGANMYGMCCPAHPVIDGVCVVRNDTICEIPSKDRLYSFQTPECFRLSDFYKICPTINEVGGCLGIAEIFSNAGISPHVIESNDRCFKITMPIDFEIFKAFLIKDNKEGSQFEMEEKDIKLKDEMKHVNVSGKNVEAGDIYIDDSEDIIMSQFKGMISSGLPIILFGFGGSVFRMYDHLTSLGMEITYIVDNDQKKQGEQWGDAIVISFQELKRKYMDCNIIITVSSYNFAYEIKKQILEDGQFDKIYHFNLYYPFGDEARRLIDDHMQEIKKVYDLLEDEKSKKCFLDKINYILTKKDEYLKCNSDYREYFPEDIFRFSEKEFFVDAGAFHGEDTLALSEIVKDVCAVCIEPDRDNFKALIENIKEKENVFCIQAAVWNENTTLCFAEAGSMGSALNEKGNTYVDAVSLDNIVEEQVSFIKMDVEGAEPEAIEGSKGLIRKNLPKLAICVYHKIEHHWEIPLLLHQIVPRYKIYMRQHDQTGIETVCYATVEPSIGDAGNKNPSSP